MTRGERCSSSSRGIRGGTFNVALSTAAAAALVICLDVRSRVSASRFRGSAPGSVEAASIVSSPLFAACCWQSRQSSLGTAAVFTSSFSVLFSLLLVLLLLVIIVSSVVAIVVRVIVHRIHVAVVLAIGRAARREVAIAGIGAGCSQLPCCNRNGKEEQTHVVPEAGETGERKQRNRECV